MKRKAIVMFVVVSFLLFAFFVGCNNGTTYTDIGSPGNDDEFVLVPVEPIDPPYENIPTLSNYDVIFAGEDHTWAEIYDVYPKLMKYYYSLGVRDFAFEGGYGSTLLLQYYIETGDEECLNVIFRDYKGSWALNREKYNFFKTLHIWNSGLKQKINIHSFDVEMQFDSAIAAIYLYILKKYPRIEGIPGISAPGSAQELVNDFKNNKARYSRLSAKDMILFERIIKNMEQGLKYKGPPENDSSREQNMANNFRNIISDTGGRKIFATMGWNHASLNGKKEHITDYGFTMASLLKNEISIASIVLRQQPDLERFQYNISIRETEVTYMNSTYDGDWPFPDGSGYSGHLPYITRFVAGIRLIDSENGVPEKTVFNAGEEFLYGFNASDRKGDWKQMVHTVTLGINKTDRSWNITGDFIGSTSIGTNGRYRLETSGTYEMTWYIVDRAGNKSNIITRTITVR